VIIHLGRTLPDGSSDLPGNAACRNRRLNGQPIRVSLFGLAPRGVCLAAAVASDAGELLPHRFTHHLQRGWPILCCTCRSFCYKAPGSYPARCPLVFGLSSCRIGRRSPDLLRLKAR